jgi:hypothetical protein
MRKKLMTEGAIKAGFRENTPARSASKKRQVVKKGSREDFCHSNLETRRAR